MEIVLHAVEVPLIQQPVESRVEVPLFQRRPSQLPVETIEPRIEHQEEIVERQVGLVVSTLWAVEVPRVQEEEKKKKEKKKKEDKMEKKKEERRGCTSSNRITRVSRRTSSGWTSRGSSWRMGAPARITTGCCLP